MSTSGRFPRTRVYPRVCGGTSSHHRSSRGRWGLSPRVRGNPADDDKQMIIERSIPACAGEPGMMSSCSDTSRVYPRVCGGTVGGFGFAIYAWGLSPRVRGNHDDTLEVIYQQRSIPACAGEPTPERAGVRPMRVYPRVCGGTGGQEMTGIAEQGLSPRVRGNPHLLMIRNGSLRSIPACAGEPAPLRTPRGAAAVYPRVCGGTTDALVLTPGGSGLSPRVRGNPRQPAFRFASPGSIPACAGEPMVRRPALAGQWVYPRVCGGTRWESPDIPPPQGLSPRVRGNPVRGVAQDMQRRSIPACAGEPAAAPVIATNWPVYPRVCGGTNVYARSSMCNEGLSPRVRGNHGVTIRITASERSIPACAGEPWGNGLPSPPHWVYPRVCGGTQLNHAALATAGGLSPRVRGNQQFISLI